MLYTHSDFALKEERPSERLKEQSRISPSANRLCLFTPMFVDDFSTQMYPIKSMFYWKYTLDLQGNL